MPFYLGRKPSNNDRCFWGIYIKFVASGSFFCMLAIEHLKKMIDLPIIFGKMGHIK